ncbi:MAG TPA: diguanylate cyclase [Gammaproteobacteria bacterium]|nr:diguanylate cyclase [Gammaproteobacteria bacterium]
MDAASENFSALIVAAAGASVPLEEALREDGLETRRVTSMDEAVTAFGGRDNPALVLVDWNSCELDREKLLAQLRAAERPLLLVALLNGGDGVQEAQRLGVDDVLRLPAADAEMALRFSLWRRVLALQQAACAGASHDALTGLYSHGLIQEATQHELDRSVREGMPVSVLLTDIDHLRQINETYGHQMGDKVLAEAARRLRVALRSYDLSGRYGGEEFLTVLPRCGRANAIEVGERIRRAMLAEPFEIDRLRLDVTVSVGIATSLGDEQVSARKIIRAADHALYKAKREGRNRVEMAVSLKTWAGRSN